MIVSRGSTFMRLSNNVVKNYLLQTRSRNLQKQIARRHGEYYYRKLAEAPPKSKLYAEILGGIAWWWLVWHILTDYHELIGSSPYPDPASWTDEELGIPPEDEN